MGASRVKYFAAGVLAFAIWGTFSIPLRLLKGYPSDQILYYRVFTSLLITWTTIFLFRQSQIKEDIKKFKAADVGQKRNLVFLSILAAILVTGNWFTFIYAVNHVSLKSAAFAYMVCPLITALGGFFILREHLTPIKLISIGLALVSVIILATGSFVEVMWSVFIASLYAFYLIIQRVITQVDKLNILGIQLLISTIMMLPFFIWKHQPMPVDFVFWATIIVIAIVFTIVPLFLSMYALIGMPSSTLGIIIYINPIIAFTVAFYYFNESFDSQQLMAYGLLLLAVFIFNWGVFKDIFSGLRQRMVKA